MSIGAQREGQHGLPVQGREAGSPDQAFACWTATAEGQRQWQATCPDLPQAEVCNALANTRASRFGLLLTCRGAIIWSRYSQVTYTRLAPLYEEVAQTGLCFWWEGGTFSRVGKESFFDRIATLPGLPPVPDRHPHQVVPDSDRTCGHTAG